LKGGAKKRGEFKHKNPPQPSFEKGGRMRKDKILQKYIAMI
jgi:hypothetical protein